MNFFVVPPEIREINKRGQNKLRGEGGGGVSKNHEKNKRLPLVYLEPESKNITHDKPQ